MAEHKSTYILLMVLTVIVYVVTLIINYLASAGNNVLFQNATGSVSDYYYLEITPAGWTFAVTWSCIYLWQTAWILYSLTTIFRRTSYGYLYVNPCHIPMSVYVCFIINNITNFTWLIVWDRFLPQYGLILITVSAAALYRALFSSFRKLYQTGSVLIQEKAGKDIWLTRVLLQNGMAFYATWVTIATLINLSVVMAYKLSVDQSVSSTVGQCLLALIIGTWFFAEVAFFDKYVRYIITPYVVVILALTGIIVQNWDAYNSNSALAAFILAGTGIATVVKVGLTIWRHRMVPIFQELPLFQEGRNYGSCDYMPITLS